MAVRRDHGDDIRQDVAQQQHDDYVMNLSSFVPDVICMPCDEDFPDCCFVEDTAVAVDGVAFLPNMGHVSRKGEVVSTKEALAGAGWEVVMSKEVTSDEHATVDGGDVLFTGYEFFVGLSDRTTAAGVAALQSVFEGFPVTPIKLPPGAALHLKSLVTMAAPGILSFADCASARGVARQMWDASPLQRQPRLNEREGRLRGLFVGPADGANVVYANDTLLVRSDQEVATAALKDELKRKVRFVEVRGAPIVLSAANSNTPHPSYCRLTPASWEKQTEC
jgi:dimethylargininase